MMNSLTMQATSGVKNALLLATHGESYAVSSLSKKDTCSFFSNWWFLLWFKGEFFSTRGDQHRLEGKSFSTKGVWHMSVLATWDC